MANEYRGVGLNGGEFISDTASHTGRWFSIVSTDDATQITSISGNITNLDDATTGGGATVTLTKNSALYGAFDEITLAAGSVIAYNRQMLTHDLNVSVGRPYTTSGVPESGGPPPGPDGVIQSEAGDFLQVEAGQYLAFD